MTEFLNATKPTGFLVPDDGPPEPMEGEIVRKEKEQDDIVENKTERLSNLLTSQGSPGIFQLMLDSGAEIEALQEGAFKEEEISKILMDVENISAVDVALAEDPLIGPTILRINKRQQDVTRRLLNTAEEFEDGAAGSVLEFIDQLGYDTWIGLKDTVTDQTMLRGEGTEVTELSKMWADAMRTMDDDQFNAFVEERFRDLGGNLASGSEPAWRVYRELQALESAGVVLWDKEMGRVAGVMSALDTATLGLTGVLKTAQVGRSVIGRLRRTAGTRAATEAVTGTSLTVRGGLDGEILDAQPLVEDLSATVPGRSGPRCERPSRKINPNADEAEIIEDIAPGMYSPRVNPTNTPKPPPTAFGSLGRDLNRNIFIRRYLERAAGRSFGAVGLPEKALREATILADKLADSSATRALDIDISEVTPTTFKADLVFGKMDGTPFTSYQSASKVAQDIPNAKVVDTRTNQIATFDSGSGQFAVKVEAPISSKGLVSELDLSEIGNRTFLGKLFGRADAKSSSFMANIADAADAGGQGLAKDFQPLFKRLSKLPKKDAEAVNTILTTLRDTPTNGNARMWLTPTEFGQQYKSLTGQWPTRETIEAYQSAIEMSDFSWFTLASDRLRILFNQKATVINAEGKDLLAIPTQTKKGGVDQQYVWDASQGKAIKTVDLSDDAVLYAFDRPRSLPVGPTRRNNLQFVVNFQGNSRLPTLEDAFPYNAGGPRSNPEVTWFVGTHDDGWSTLIGARSEKEATAAVDEINTLVLAKQDGSLSDSVVLANNKWNPNIETVDQLVEFAEKRGLDLDTPVILRRRDEKVQDGVAVADDYYVNMSYEKFTTLHRHDIALVEYGGAKASNPDPIAAVMDQFTRMASRAASVHYRMQHPTSWVNAVQRAVSKGELRVNNISVKGSDEIKVKAWEIEGESEMARKLRSEQLIIQRRLGSGSSLLDDMVRSGTGSGVSEAADRMVEAVHNFSPKMAVPAKYISESFVKGGNNKLLSLGFFQNMASLDQIFVQTSHIIPVSAASPINGPRAVMLATVARQAGRTTVPDSAWKTIYNNLSKSMGIPEDDLDNMMEHLFLSGRGYMRGAIAEDPAAGILSRGIPSKIGKVLSAPYYAGENFAATVSRLTAYLDVRKAHPTLNPKSDLFWNKVQQRDRDLSFALNRSQRSLAQDESTLRVVTQWTSYPIRTIENVFNANLTKVERARMFAASTILWGVSGASLYGMASSAREEFPGPLAEIIADGADYALKELFGIKPGRRLSLNPAELIERAVGTFTDPFATIPAARIAEETYSPAVSAVANFASGRTSLGWHDLETLVRAWKIVDAPVMAYQMMMHDIRVSTSGNSIGKDFTTSQEFFQALGFTPSEVVEKYSFQRMTWGGAKDRAEAVNKATDIVKLAKQAFEKGDMEAGIQLWKTADAVVLAYGFNDVRLSEVRSKIINNIGQDEYSWLLLNLIKDGNLEHAEKWKENNDG